MKTEEFLGDRTLMPTLKEGVLRIPGEPMVALQMGANGKYHVGMECMMPSPFSTGLMPVVVCIGHDIPEDTVFDFLVANAKYRREQAGSNA